MAKKANQSKDFKKVKMYYQMGFYSIQMLKMVVGKMITADEYEEITGEPCDE